jgi:hypothetical protein
MYEMWFLLSIEIGTIKDILRHDDITTVNIRSWRSENVISPVFHFSDLCLRSLDVKSAASRIRISHIALPLCWKGMSVTGGYTLLSVKWQAMMFGPLIWSGRYQAAALL